jgi:tRNA(fMet)-specific endonuclease VapC
VILDTNGLSAVADGDASLIPILRQATEIAVPVIVLGEYRYGVRLMDSLPNYRILDVDQETTIYYATLRTELKKAGTPIPANDVWVAALCRQYRLPILSRDRHFDIVAGLRRIDW